MSKHSEFWNREFETPRVGIGTMIFKDGKVLLGKRKSVLGRGGYSFPGGHLEGGESLVDCALRETREECGIEVEHVRFGLLGNVLEFSPRHYVQVGFIADWKSGLPKVLEPDKCEGWDWYALAALPEPLFGPTKMLIANYQAGTHFCDSKQKSP